MPRDKRFAVSRRRKRVEIARASPRTVATLDVLGLKIPFRWHRSNPPCPGFVSALCYLRRARRPPVPPIPHVHIATSPTDRRMVETAPAEPAGLLRHLTIPVAVAVALAVGAAWYATWTSADVLMALMAPSLLRSTDLVLFFALLVVMMVAMMLPSALPMILAYRGMTRLEAGRPTKPADDAATALFIAPYFLVWGAFGVAALLALSALGLMGAMTGPLAFASAGTLVAAGALQVHPTEGGSFAYRTSPLSFLLHHWRSGRSGAVRMCFWC